MDYLPCKRQLWMPPCFCVSLAEDELDPNYWNNKAKQSIHGALAVQRVQQQAKNLILFLGDGESFLSKSFIYGSTKKQKQ